MCRWCVRDGACLQPDPLGVHGAHIFACSAAGTELRVNPDSYSWYKLDSPGVAAFHTGETAAVFCQTELVTGDSQLIRLWSRRKILRLGSVSRELSIAIQSVLDGKDRLSQ